MPTYVARIRDSQGKSRKETLIAESLVEARTNLRQQGFVVQDLKQSQGFKFDLQKIKNSFCQSFC